MSHNIAKFVTNGYYKQALHLYSHLRSSSLPINHFSYPCLLKSCAKLNYPLQGQIIHTHLIKSGFYCDTYAATGLTHMYMKFRQVKYALKVFDEMPQRNEASFNAMISGFAQNGYFGEALVVFREVGLKRCRPNSVMIASVLSACDVVENGSQVHCWAVKIGVERDVYVATGVVTMYMICSEVVSATKAFGMMNYKNVVSYNAFMSGLVQNGVYRVVLKVFKGMFETSSEGPNAVTLVTVLGACSNVTNLRFGRQVHGVAVKVGLQFDIMVGTALVDMYTKCGSCSGYHVFREMKGNRNLITWNSIIAGMFLTGNCDAALKLFSELESEGLVPDSATWNTMISGFSKQGKYESALQFFTVMVSEGIAPSLKSLTSLLDACSMISSLQLGNQIHAAAIRADISNDEFFTTALIDMHMKCGQSSWARKIFDHYKNKPDDPAFWNAMISGYGRNSEEDSAFEIFNLMQKENVGPNSSTFANLLTVCSHAGQLDKGLQVFEMMTTEYGLIPTQQHFACIIDLLGRSGHLQKAHELIQEIPEISSSVYSSLLGAAGHHLDPKLGEDMAKELSELEPGNRATFVVLSNVYAAMGRWEDVERIRKMIDVKGLEKYPGYSVQIT
ncbi:pentatricopeptide repeat-containing protein At2g02750-like [Chenopodium quinoa]|uniref:Pentatricopeptide repeat-containing protein n=1 Tax=Chenopodium quinoa TaxID=63459 RepID=A0A803L1K0_CHEQI|nr:pentatricopeptide repeat-containing protein At2g02750-like [Chenopodium quinoa]